MTTERFLHNGIVFTIVLDNIANHRKEYPNPPPNVDYYAISFQSVVGKFGRKGLIAHEIMHEQWRPSLCNLLLEKYEQWRASRKSKIILP